MLQWNTYTPTHTHGQHWMGLAGYFLKNKTKDIKLVGRKLRRTWGWGREIDRNVMKICYIHIRNSQRIKIIVKKKRILSFMITSLKMEDTKLS